MMVKFYVMVGAAALLLVGAVGMDLQTRVDADRSVPFEVASIVFEQNATDEDVEVVFKVNGGGNEGLAKLTVASPDGGTVIDFTAPNAAPLGIRQFVFESPEPGDVQSLKSAYPEGVYTFTGRTAEGTQLYGQASLHHTLPATATFLHPGPDAQEVGTKGMSITWNPLKNLTAYIIEIEQEELEVNVTATLPGSATSFAVPDGFLLPGTEYKVAIGTVTAEGNASFVETSFTTAEVKKASTDIASIEPVWENFDAGNFSYPTNIDNEWHPLKPGMHWAYEGTTTEDGETLSHRLEFTVTDLTKEIAGVQTVVGYLVDYADGEVVEKEIAFYAQDDDGNVWFLGEYPEEYEDGKVIDAPTWIAGLDGAKPGLDMRAKPELRTSPYFQGWGPRVGWSDFAQVHQMGEKVCIPADCFSDVLVIAESALDEIGAFQLKYYARGVGGIRVGWKGDDGTKEELELVTFTQLDQEALDRIRTAAYDLEKHAFELSPEMYALTVPLSGSPATLLARSGIYADSKLKPKNVKMKSPVSIISEADAERIALKAVPGVAIDIAIERKLGAKRYVVEVIADKDGGETDVILDMETGKVIATEN